MKTLEGHEINAWFHLYYYEFSLYQQIGVGVMAHGELKLREYH